MTDRECIQINQAVFSIRNIYESRMLKENEENDQLPGIGEMGVLMVIGQFPKINARELAEKMDLARPTISIYVKRLAEKELLSQTRSTADRRYWDLDLTDEGRVLYEHARSATVAYTRNIVASLDPQEQKQFLALILKLVRRNGYEWI